MKTIDLNRIREGLPKRAVVKLVKYNGSEKGKGSPAIECFIPEKYLSDKDWKMVMDWQEDIIGKENIAEFYSEEEGRHWFVFLKRVPLEFINAQDADINSFADMELVENGKLKS